MNTIGDSTKTRLFYSDGRIDGYDDPKLAYAVWLELDKGIRVAFRSAGDITPVYHQDYVDKR